MSSPRPLLSFPLLEEHLVLVPRDRPPSESAALLCANAAPGWAGCAAVLYGGTEYAQADGYWSALESRVSGRVLKLESRCPWKEHLNEIEDEMGLTDGEGKSILYVVYSDDKGQWRIQCVPQSPESFVSRKPLPASWRGVRDEDLSSVAGIEGCVFCHASGFIGGNRTLDGALQMVDKALKEDQ